MSDDWTDTVFLFFHAFGFALGLGLGLAGAAGIVFGLLWLFGVAR